MSLAYKAALQLTILLKTAILCCTLVHNYDYLSSTWDKGRKGKVRKITEGQMVRFSRDEVSSALFSGKRRPTLDPCVAERLFLEAKSEDRKTRDAAIERLALANVGLVVFIAKRYVRRGLPLEDLIQEGLIQLITRTIPRFDTKRGVKFSTFATIGLRRAFILACAEKGEGKAYYLPSHIRYRESVIKTAQSEFRATLGRRPSPKEIFALLQTRESNIAKKLSVEVIEKLINAANGDTLSLSHPVSDDGSLLLEDRLAANSNGKGIELSAIASDEFARWSRSLCEVLPQLKERERDTIVLRFGLATGVPKTLHAIGNTFGLTRERIRQMERTAIRRIAKRWKIKDDGVKNVLQSLRELGFKIQGQFPPPVKTDVPSTKVSSEVLSEHAIAMSDGKYVVKPARTLAARLQIDEETARLAVEACAREGAFAFVEGCDAVRL